MFRTRLLLSVLALAASASAAPETLPGVSDPAWDALFVQNDGWTGGDGAFSIDLQDGRVLWLFGDTFVGPVVGGKHGPGTTMVNNTVAVHPKGENGAPPARESLHFAWGPAGKDGKPTAWIRPEPPVASTDPNATPTWYWPMHGFVSSEPSGKTRLVMFLAEMARSGSKDPGWDFRGVGGALAIVDDFSGPPETWRPRQVRNPHVVTDKPEIMWGNATWLYPFSMHWNCPVYVFGIKETHPLNKQLLLARTLTRSVEDFSTWKFRTKDGWSKDLKDAVPVADGLVNELSVDRVAGRDEDESRLVMVHSEPVFGSHLLVRTAVRPEGPWSAPKAVYDVPDVGGETKRFTYAAKGHPECSRPGELLITCAVNSFDFADVLQHAHVYRPYAVRVPLTALDAGK